MTPCSCPCVPLLSVSPSLAVNIRRSPPEVRFCTDLDALFLHVRQNSQLLTRTGRHIWLGAMTLSVKSITRPLVV
jgi:hypothetical protein